MYKKVILPTDGSKASLAGVKEGLRAAKMLDIPAVSIYVFRPDLYSQVRLERVDFTARELLIKDLKKLAEHKLNMVEKMADEMGVNIETEIVEGLPHEEITKFADKGDIIYMSSHGRSGLSSVFLGSTTDRVIKNSKTTVAVVRSKRD